VSGGDTKPEKLTDQQRIDQQVATINVTSAVSEVTGSLFGHPGRPVLGKTNFEGHSLNAMVDLVDDTNPADLEHAGEALGKASKAISEAAEELRRHLKYAGQDWKGEAGTAFQKWGEQLATHTEALAKYAEDAKVQVSTAATGLASVRSAMPSRDTRPAGEQKKPTALPEAKQVEGNRQYAEAVKVEKDRQEAINQMNRLASFYSVSGGALGKLEPPAFEAMPSVGVPDPIERSQDSGAKSAGSATGTARKSVTTVPQSSHVSVSHSDSGDIVLPSTDLVVDDELDRRRPSAPSVGTEIDHVGTLPPEVAKTVPTAPASTASNPSGPSASTIPPMAAGTVPPAFGRTASRSTGVGGTAGGRAPVSAQGRATTPRVPAAEARGGRGPLGSVGRATGVGQPGARGPVSSTGRAPVGRGVTGGVPRSAGGAGQRTGAVPGGRVQGVSGQPISRTGPGSTGAARTGGVVGGRPTAESGRPATGNSVPRGMVIGGEGAPTARTSGERPGQRGVIGVNGGQPSNRSMPTSNRVIGASSDKTGTKRENPAGGSGGQGTRRQQNAAEGKKRRDGDTPSETD
jgi:uncharacterized protein YukE